MTDLRKERRMLSDAVDSLIAVRLRHYGSRPFRKDQLVTAVFLRYEWAPKDEPRGALLLSDFIAARVTRAVNRAQDAKGRRQYGWYWADGERRYQLGPALTVRRFRDFREEARKSVERDLAQLAFYDRVDDQIEVLGLGDDASVRAAWEAAEEEAA